MDKVKIGCPIEYECDDGIIHDGLFLRESEIKELEKKLKEINKITDLKQQVKKQKEGIDRAIELLKSQEQDMMGNYFFDDNIAEQLLDILEKVSK